MKKLLIILLLFIALPAFSAQDRAVIKVGISNTAFSTFQYKNASFFTSGDILVIDMSSAQNYNALKNSTVIVELIDGFFKVSSDDVVLIENSHGPIVLSANNLISIKDLKRKGMQASYGGQIELKITKNLNTFNIINVIDMNSYLKGVVPNEMPVSFGLEALKAQAITARNYASRDSNPKSNYDICDSTACQVYFGANTYNPLSDRAVEQTKGIYALHNHEPILALYSSTAGGITENYDNVFAYGRILPYLRSVGGKLKSEAEVRDFYSSTPNSPDIKSPLYRWKIEWDRVELEEILNKTLFEQSNAGLVEPKFEKGFKIGTLNDIKVLKRGDSGKALEIEIVAKNGCWKVKKEIGIRRVLKKNNRVLYSANFFIDKVENKISLADILKPDYVSDSKLQKIILTGGGFGHGVGMSQYGAGYLAADGKSYVDILRYYYSGIVVGTIAKPVDTLNKQSLSFYYNKKADKNVAFKFDNTKRLSEFRFYINNLEFNPVMNRFGDKILWFDITKYLKNGYNEIVVMPLNPRDKNKKGYFWIEFLD